jgi:hypothetical protein
MNIWNKNILGGKFRNQSIYWDGLNTPGLDELIDIAVKNKIFNN